MAIKAKFAEGATSATTKSLFQWDYGQKLEIEAADLPATFEVHFSCRGMSEAAVVPCSATNGVAIVTVPDRCLEQSAEITAWVYEIEGESGTTTKVITIPVVARARPSTGDEVPASAVDKYTELITAVNAALAALRDGTVTVAKATNAASADYATSAGNAGTTNFAVQANHALNSTGATVLSGMVPIMHWMEGYPMTGYYPVYQTGLYLLLVRKSEFSDETYTMLINISSTEKKAYATDITVWYDPATHNISLENFASASFFTGIYKLVAYQEG
jgi:hypothetical protein